MQHREDIKREKFHNRIVLVDVVEQKEDKELLQRLENRKHSTPYREYLDEKTLDKRM